MEIELLKEFLVLSECLNYRNAAEKLYISQSVLSRHIQSLESTLGVALFERNKHSVVLTPSGRMFAVDGRRVVDEYNKALKHIHMAKKGMIGKLDISTSKTVCPFFVYDFMVEFEKKYPHIQVNLNVEDGDASLIQHIQSGSRDFAIMLNWEKHREKMLGGYTFFRDPLYVIVPKHHPIAKMESVRICELRDEKIISCHKKDNPHAHDFFEKLFSDNGIVYAPKVYVSGLEIIFYRIISGDGISIISGTALGTLPSNIAAVKIEDAQGIVDVDIIWNPQSDNLSVPVFLEEFGRFSKMYNRLKS